MLCSKCSRQKDPGPDGFQAHFLQHYWDVCGKEVTSAVLRIVKGVDSAESINESVLVLIPKVENPTLLSQFRPISLCNVVYKIISKMITNRLKKILPELISPTQSGFVLGRLITDNVLVAYESFHAIKKKTHGSNGYCVVKLDIHKAYD
mgnify:CR=1 FL=1